MSLIETDHEFKTRMAAEGRAIYIPGKTVEEFNAEQKRKTKPKAITINLSEDDLTAILHALPNTFDLISDLGRAMTFLGCEGPLDVVEASDVGATLRLFARAIEGGVARDLEPLFKLETKLRDAAPKKDV